MQTRPDVSYSVIRVDVVNVANADVFLKFFGDLVLVKLVVVQLFLLSHTQRRSRRQHWRRHGGGSYGWDGLCRVGCGSLGLWLGRRCLWGWQVAPRWLERAA